MKILVISAHIDDAEFGMGGTLIKARDAGDEIILALTHADDDLGGDISIRKKEQEQSAEILKARCIFIEQKTPIEKKVSILDKIGPDVIYYAYEKDTHQHHLEASRVGFAVARNTKINVLRYISQSSHSCYPNYLSIINMDQKKNLVSVFKSQNGRQPKFIEIMMAQNRYFASLIYGKGDYAEAFVVFRMIVA